MFVSLSVSICLSLCLSVSLSFVYVYTIFLAYRYIQLCLHVWRPDVDTLYRCLIELGACQSTRLADQQPPQSTISSNPVLEPQTCITTSDCYVGVGGANQVSLLIQQVLYPLRRPPVPWAVTIHLMLFWTSSTSSVPPRIIVIKVGYKIENVTVADLQ